MKKLLDSMASASTWTVTGGTRVAVDWPQLRASWTAGQLRVDLDANGYIEREFDPVVDVAGLDTVGFSLCALNYEEEPDLRIRIWTDDTTSREFLIQPDPLAGGSQGFRTYAFYLPYAAIAKIQISAKKAVKFIACDLCAYRDRLPEDILEGLKKTVEQFPPDSFPLVGTAAVVAIGDEKITMQGEANFAEQFSYIKIGSEVHQLAAVNPTNPVLPGSGYELVFGQMADGETATAAHAADTPVYLYIPILTNPKHVEGVTPCISIEGGFDPETIKELSFAGSLEVCRDTETPRNIYKREMAGTKAFKFICHGLYRSLETKALVRAQLGQVQSINQPVWVNGRKLVAYFGGITDISFQEDRGETGELQLTVEVRAEESRWQTQQIPINLEATINQPEPVQNLP